jgi:uncharacterized protein (DUF3084 family)
MNEPWNNDVTSYRARLMEMVPSDQLPFAEFELRMLLTTVETDHLRDIHTNWRPIADERNKLRAELIALSQPAPAPAAEPAESRRGARTKAELLQRQLDELQKKYAELEKGPVKSGNEDDSPRFKALSHEHKTLQTNHTGLRERHQKLHEDYSDLEAKYKALQIACGEVEA